MITKLKSDITDIDLGYPRLVINDFEIIVFDNQEEFNQYMLTLYPPVEDSGQSSP